MLAAHGHLAKVANGEPLFPRLHLADPVFAADVEGLPSALKNVVGEIAGKVKGKAGVKTLTKFKASKTFFNFAPCVLQETHVSWMGGGEKRAREREREREGERETTMRSPPPGPLGPLTSSPRPALTHPPPPIPPSFYRPALSATWGASTSRPSCLASTRPSGGRPSRPCRSRPS